MILLGNQAATAFYVGLPSPWDSMDGDLMFFVGGLHFGGLCQTSMDRPVALMMGHLSSYGPMGNMEGSFLQETEGKMNFQGMGCRRFVDGVSLHRGSVRVHWEGIMEGGLWKWS
jgi:uncharacterized RDD family membrane protein YckC